MLMGDKPCGALSYFMFLHGLLAVPLKDRISGVRRFNCIWRTAFPSRMRTPASFFSVEHKVGGSEDCYA